MRTLLSCSLLFWFAACSSPKAEDEILVFGAASTQAALTLAAEAYQQRTGVKVTVNCAASSVLARQIDHGAPAHLFISANAQWTEYLLEQGLLEKQHIVPLLENRLVLLGPKEVGPISLEDGVPSGSGRIAIADPSHVPVGIYAKQALNWLGWWDGLASRMIPAQNASATLRLLTLGEADLAIVYASDASALDPAFHVLATLPEQSHDPIRYPLAMIGANPSHQTRDFFVFLRSPSVLSMFEQHGFPRSTGTD